MSASFADRTIGEIAATLPGATAIFRRHKLDFCCGGGIPLAEHQHGFWIVVSIVIAFTAIAAWLAFRKKRYQD